MKAILVVNAGSSSVKFALFEHGDRQGALPLVAKGHVARIGKEVELAVKGADGTLLTREAVPASEEHAFDHDSALSRLFAWLGDQGEGVTLAAVGHRVVHGGASHDGPVRVDERVLQSLTDLVPLAPLHQPHNLAAIRVIAGRWPEVAQVACFDTAFHRTQPALAQAFALPRSVTDLGVRRYGFHGLSYEHIASRLPSVLPPERAQGRVIVAHLGNGASLCGMKDGRSAVSTMGFSALDGLVMGTRCGTLDAGVVLYLLQQQHMSAEAVSDMLYSHAGLLGVSGISGDMQVLLGSQDPRAAEAIDLFVHRVTAQIGELSAVLGGLEALVFTAGIGEHAAPIRARICQGAAWLGAVLDEQANSRHDTLIHAPDSKVHLAVIPTDEERMIALHTRDALSDRPT